MVEIKDRNYNKFCLERKRRKNKIAEWTPPSVNRINLNEHLCGFLSKKSSHEENHQSRWIIRNYLITSRNLTSLRLVQQNTRQFGRPPRAESVMKRPVSIEKNAPIIPL